MKKKILPQCYQQIKMNGNRYMPLLSLLVLMLCAPLPAFSQENSPNSLPPLQKEENEQEIRVTISSSMRIFQKIAKKLQTKYTSKKASVDYNALFNDLFLLSGEDRTFRYTDSEKKLLVDTIVAVYKDPDNPEKDLREFLGNNFDFSKILGNDIKKVTGTGIVQNIANNRKESKWTAFLNILYTSLNISKMQGMSGVYGVKGTGESDLRNLKSVNSNIRANNFINDKGYRNNDGKKFVSDGLMNSEVVAYLIREYIQARKLLQTDVINEKETVGKKDKKKKPMMTVAQVRERVFADHKCAEKKGFKTTLGALDLQINDRLIKVIKKGDKKNTIMNPQFQVIRKMTKDLTFCLPELYKEFKALEAEYLESFMIKSHIEPPSTGLSLNKLENKREEIQLIMGGLKKNVAAFEDLSFSTIVERRGLKFMGLELEALKDATIEVQEDQKNILRKISRIIKKKGDTNYPWGKVKERNRSDIAFIFENIGVIQLYISKINEKIEVIDNIRRRKKVRGVDSWTNKIFSTKGFRLIKRFDDNLTSVLSANGVNISDIVLEGVLGFAHVKSPTFKAELLGILEYQPTQEIYSKGVELGGNWYYPNSRIFGLDLTVNPYLRRNTFTVSQNSATASIDGESRTVDTFIEISQIQLGNRFRFKGWKKSYWDITFFFKQSSVSGDLNDTSTGESYSAEGNTSGIGIELGFGVKF